MADSTITELTGTGDGTLADPPDPSSTRSRVPAASGEQPNARWITRRRLAKWNRPRDPHDWRWFVANVGKVLIATGLLLFGFVAYQLWGTGLETARAQRALATEFDELLASTPPPPPAVAQPEPDPDTGSGTGSSQSEILQPDDGIAPEPIETEAEPEPEPLPEPLVIRGAPIARIEMPTIGVEEIVVSGVAPNDLQKGPGHFPRTALPGQLGNAAIAGHRTTYGQPFRDVDRLEPGDEIVVTTVQGRFVYRVTGTEIVAPQDSHVVTTTDPDVARLTLVSCHPVLSAAQRIIVFADLDLDQSTPAPTTTTDDDPDDAAFGDLPSEDIAETEPEVETEPEPEVVAETEAEPEVQVQTEPEVVTETEPTEATDDESATAATDVTATEAPEVEIDDELDDAFGRGWFHDRDAFGQIGLWGALLALVSIAAYALSRVTRRDLVGFTVGVAPFAVAAFFFFQNINRLLPPGL